jgi:hypothetical protein
MHKVPVLNNKQATPIDETGEEAYQSGALLELLRGTGRARNMELVQTLC